MDYSNVIFTNNLYLLWVGPNHILFLLRSYYDADAATFAHCTWKELGVSFDIIFLVFYF